MLPPTNGILRWLLYNRYFANGLQIRVRQLQFSHAKGESGCCRIYQRRGGRKYINIHYQSLSQPESLLCRTWRQYVRPNRRYPRTNDTVFHFTGHNKSKRASLATVTIHKVANSAFKNSHVALLQAKKMVAVFWYNFVSNSCQFLSSKTVRMASTVSVY